MSMLIEVWADYACFSRPEMKSERVSYDVMHPVRRARSGRSDLLASRSEIYCGPYLRALPDQVHQHTPQRGQGHASRFRRR